MLELYGEWRQALQFNVEKYFFVDFSCAHEHSFSMFYHSVNNICYQHDDKHKELQLRSFLKVYREKHQRNSRKCRERSSTHTCQLLAPARSHGASSKPTFSRTCGIGFTSICEFEFDRQMSSGANDQANVLQFAAFRDHGWGHVARMFL